jgi:hypothetical protein
LKTKPHLRSCCKRCTHCRIFFLTDPRNRGREDLGCPFGCRDSHRRKCSTERSTAYNRSPAGKLKRKQGREKKRRSQAPSELTGDEFPKEKNALSAAETAWRAELADLKLEMPLVEYLRAVTSLIEARAVRREEILQMLRRAMVQRSFARERRLDYLVRTLKEKPP